MSLQNYKLKKIQIYKQRKSLIVESDANIKGTAIRRKIHPFLRKVLHVKSKICGLTYEIIGDESTETKDETVIYALTHIGKCDFEMFMEAYDAMFYPLAGDWELSYGTVDDYFLRTNGILYVDTEDKSDRANSAKMMVKLLRQGMSVLIFPEGIWNLSESLPVLGLYSGAVAAAKDAKVSIVPVAIEQREKHFYINIGKKLDVIDLQTDEGVQILRDTMATLRWKIWERLPIERREDIETGWYKRFVEERLQECLYLNRDIVNGRVYRDKRIATAEEVFAFMEKLEVKKETAFLLRR